LEGSIPFTRHSLAGLPAESDRVSTQNKS